MRKNFTKTLVLGLALMTTAAASAYDFEVDGIYYAKDGGAVVVTYATSDYNTYSGDLVIPSTVTYGSTTYSVICAGYRACQASTGLTSVTFPVSPSFYFVGAYSFYGCTGLTSLYIPSNFTKIEANSFYGCTGLKSITFEEGITEIKSSAFYGCTSIDTLYFPTTLTTIATNAFNGCTGLTKVTFQEYMSSIGSYAFYGCTSIADVYSYATTPPVWSSTTNSFSATVYNTATLHVPTDAIDTYASTAPWSNFKTIVSTDESGITATLADTDELKISAIDGEIAVAGATGEISVYNLAGSLCGKAWSDGSAASISVNAPGIYIVKAAGKATKVKL